jgi:hypothetical protein
LTIDKEDIMVKEEDKEVKTLRIGTEFIERAEKVVRDLSPHLTNLTASTVVESAINVAYAVLQQKFGGNLQLFIVDTNTLQQPTLGADN